MRKLPFYLMTNLSMTINSLSQYFLENHPRDAARILEQYTPEELATYLEQFSSQTAANMFRHINPSIAVGCLVKMGLEKSAEIIGQFSIERASMLLRRMSFTDRIRIIKALPPLTANMIKLVLRYPEGTVGQYMNPNVFAVNKDRRVSEVIETIHASYDQVRSKVYVVDDKQRLIGVVFIRDLLVSDPDVPVGKIMSEPETTFSARASLLSVRDHPQWNDRDSLPVVDQSGRFIGILKRGVMVDALARGDAGQPDNEGIIGAAMEIAELFWEVCANVIAPQHEISEKGRKK